MLCLSFDSIYFHPSHVKRELNDGHEGEVGIDLVDLFFIRDDILTGEDCHQEVEMNSKTHYLEVGRF